MLNGQGSNGENEFAEMEFINLTVVTSNEPYGVYDGSNPFFDGRTTPRFGLQKGGVHSGHVQTTIRDPFCLPNDGVGKGKCQVTDSSYDLSCRLLRRIFFLFSFLFLFLFSLFFSFLFLFLFCVQVALIDF